MKYVSLGIVVIIFGFCALANAEILGALFSYGLGIWLIMMGLRKKAQPNNIAPPVPSVPSPEPQEHWQRLQLEKPFKTITIKPVGTTFDCMFSEFYESRQKVLSFTGEGTNIALRQYTYNGEPAIAIINADLNADIGVVPRDKVEMVLDFIRKYDLVLVATDCDSFYPDDDNEDSDKEAEPIYTCKILIYAYKRNSENQ